MKIKSLEWDIDTEENAYYSQSIFYPCCYMKIECEDRFFKIYIFHGGYLYRRFNIGITSTLQEAKQEAQNYLENLFKPWIIE